jgi:hypothetical protein
MLYMNVSGKLDLRDMVEKEISVTTARVRFMENCGKYTSH